MTDGRCPRRGPAVTLAVLGLFAAAAWALVAVFELGVLAGLALAGAGLVVWALPATFLGWPGPTLEDLVGLVGLVAGVVAFIRSLFD